MIEDAHYEEAGLVHNEKATDIKRFGGITHFFIYTYLDLIPSG